jgi:hypothetical protein
LSAPSAAGFVLAAAARSTPTRATPRTTPTASGPCRPRCGRGQCRPRQAAGDRRVRPDDAALRQAAALSALLIGGGPTWRRGTTPSQDLGLVVQRSDRRLDLLRHPAFQMVPSTIGGHQRQPPDTDHTEQRHEQFEIHRRTLRRKQRAGSHAHTPACGDDPGRSALVEPTDRAQPENHASMGLSWARSPNSFGLKHSSSPGMVTASSRT